MKWRKKAQFYDPLPGQFCKIYFLVTLNRSFPFFLEREKGRERERGTRRNFADNGRADIDSDGQLGLRGPPGRICTRHTTNHSSISSIANVSFFSPRSQIQSSLFLSVSLFPSFLSLSPSHSFSLVLNWIPSFYGRGSLIFWIIFPRVVCRVETLETGRKEQGGRKREREIRTVEGVRMPHTSLGSNI